MTQPIKLDIDGTSGLWLLPFAKRQLARFKTLLPFGKRRFNLPSGEEVTIWWGQQTDRIKITAAPGFELLALGSISGETNMFGLGLNPDTQFYESEISKVIDDQFPMPKERHLSQVNRFFLAEDQDHRTTFGLFFFPIPGISNNLEWYYYRNKGRSISGPFVLKQRGSSFVSDAQAVAVNRVILEDGKLKSLVIPETATQVCPTFDFQAFIARATAAAEPEGVFMTQPDFAIYRGFGGGPQELVVQVRFTRFGFPQPELIIYMERYAINKDLVPLGSSLGTGLSLLETVSKGELFFDPLHFSPIWTRTIAGPRFTLSYSMNLAPPIPDIFLVDSAVPFMVWGAEGVTAAELNQGSSIPNQISVSIGSSTTVIFEDTTGPGVAYPFSPSAYSIRIDDRSYFFLNATSTRLGMVPVGPIPVFLGGGPVLVDAWTTDSMRVIYHRGVSLDGAPMQLSAGSPHVFDWSTVFNPPQEPQSNPSPGSWDNIDPEHIYVPVVGASTPTGDMFLGFRHEQTFVPMTEMLLFGFFRMLPFTTRIAIFNADLSEVHLGPDVTDVNDFRNRGIANTMSVALYKEVLFYLFRLGASPRLTFGIPVNNPSAAPVQIGLIDTTPARTPEGLALQ